MTYFPAVDATNEAPDEIHYPEIVERLESLGFVRVGRVRVDVPAAEWHQLLSLYTPHDAEQMAAHEAVPDVVLVSPSADAYVDVGWFYDSPSLRFRTELTDGTVVETQRPWDHDPAWPVRLSKGIPHRDRREEQLCEAAEGRTSSWLTTAGQLAAALAVVLLFGVVPYFLAPRVAIRTRYLRRLRPAWR